MEKRRGSQFPFINFKAISKQEGFYQRKYKVMTSFLPETAAARTYSVRAAPGKIKFPIQPPVP